MNRTTRLFALLGLTFACAAATTFGQITNGDYGLYTLDESGNGFFQVAGTGPIPLFILSLPGTVAQDPFSGLSTLRYNVPATTSAGDLLIYDDAAQTSLSDIIRFDGQGHLFFFSKLQPGETPQLADIAQLPAPLTQFPTVSMTETNVGFGGLGVGYFPPDSTFLPGSDANPKEFLIISEVPEPATAFLLLLGAGLFLVRQLRLRSSSSALIRG
jgi:hypothetical protein